MAKKMSKVWAFFFKDQYTLLSSRWKNSLAELGFVVGVGAAIIFFILELISRA